MAKTRSKTNKTTKATTTQAAPEVYPKLRAIWHCEGETKPPLDMAWAKKTLGWKEECKEGSNVKYGGDYLLAYDSGEGKTKVRCDNNITNRPLVMSNVKMLQQEILNGRWNVNGEPIILSKKGQVLNGQHQLCALVLATLEYQQHPETYTHWKTEPTIGKLVVSGISDDDRVINTMDTCKPRSLADVIYRSSYFADSTQGDRKKASNMTQHAIRLLWQRTGENLDGLSNYRTHAEFIDFLDRHLRVLECVNFAMAENGKEGRLANYISPGYCAGLLYLFGACATDSAKYLSAEIQNEDTIDWKHFDSACDFFVLLAAGDEKFAPVRKRMAAMIEDETISLASRVGTLIKAWGLFLSGKTITEKALKLEYVEDEDGFMVLTEFPTIGGLDMGDTSTDTEEPVVTTEEVASRTADIRKEKQANGNTKAKQEDKPKPKARAKKLDTIVGKPMWVNPPNGEIYRCRVTDVVGDVAEVKILQGFKGAGNTKRLPVASLLVDQPTN